MEHGREEEERCRLQVEQGPELGMVVKQQQEPPPSAWPDDDGRTGGETPPSSPPREYLSSTQLADVFVWCRHRRYVCTVRPAIRNVGEHQREPATTGGGNKAFGVNSSSCTGCGWMLCMRRVERDVKNVNVCYP